MYICMYRYIRDATPFLGRPCRGRPYLSIYLFVNSSVYLSIIAWDLIGIKYIDASRNNRYTGILLTIEE